MPVLLWHQVEILCLVQKVPAIKTLPDVLVRFHLCREEGRGEEGQAHGPEEGREVLLARLRGVVEPREHGAKHVFLGAHVDVVAVDEGDELVPGDALEFLALDGVGEVLPEVARSFLQQLPAPVSPCEAPDTKAVGRVKLGGEELAACIPDSGEVEEGGRREKRLHVGHRYLQPRGVGKFDEELHGQVLDVVEPDDVLAGLAHVSREHGVEVATARG